MTAATAGSFDPTHRQRAYRVRLDWGPTGATALGGSEDGGVDVAVVVDVLSFTTTLTVAVERGLEVHPFPWRDTRAASYAAEHDAVLAVGRSEAVGHPGAVSLSPASVLAAEGVRRLVLPSPNGSSISAGLAGSGATVVGASLRNRRAVAGWIAGATGPRLSIGVVAAGERWPDGSLRPAAEDLWGAGAVLAALVDLGIDDLSPEARLAEEAFRAVRPRLHRDLAACASGRELIARGFPDDVLVAADLDASEAVPVLHEGIFSAG